LLVVAVDEAGVGPFGLPSRTNAEGIWPSTRLKDKNKITLSSMGRINIELEDELHKRAKSISALKGVTLMEFINQALTESVKRK
jgi:hypothetical protein